MPRLLLILLCLLVSTSLFSQQPVLQWARQLGSIESFDNYLDNGRDIQVDQQGNVYSVGVFFFTADMDPGPAVSTITAPGMGIYISKLDANGNFVWAKALPFGVSGPVKMAIDAQANVYLTSYISATVDMDPGPGVFMAPMVGSQDAFLLKLDSDGNFLWEKQFGAPGGNNGAAGYAVAVDPNNNVILCGSFYGTVDFDPGSGSYPLTGFGTSSVFLVKLSPGGNFTWAKSFGSANCEDVKCDGLGNVYTVGSFAGSTDFDPGSGSFLMTSGGPSDGYVNKLDANGNFAWAKKFGYSAGNLVVKPFALDADNQNNILITGYFLGTQDFDPGSGIFNLTTITGDSDAFLVKLDANGNFVWARNIGGTLIDYAFDVAVDNAGNSYITGVFAGAIDFDPGPGVFPDNLYDDAAVVKFNASGNFVSAAAFKKVINGIAFGRGIATDVAQNIYVTGYFGGVVDFDPGPGHQDLIETGNGWDAFVVKLSRCTNITTNTITTSSCNSYTLNNQTYDVSGTYTQVIPNATGCDSIITLNLTINKKLSQQNITICEGQSFHAGGSDQTSSGTYFDTLQTTLGCDSIITTTLLVNPKPHPDLGADQLLCSGTSLTLNPGSFPIYSWSDNSTQSNLTITSPGWYWVTVTNSNTCSARDSILITEVPSPGGFLKPLDSICSYGTLQVRPSGSFSSYLWSTGSAQSFIDVNSPGQYWLKVSDAHGCYGADTIAILPKQCLKGVYIPSAFTPNGDGKNDAFKAMVFGKTVSFKLQVYDRWGQLVFETTDPSKQWDGRNKGSNYPTTVFIWQCFYQFEGEQPEYKKGIVTLIR